MGMEASGWKRLMAAVVAGVVGTNEVPPSDARELGAFTKEKERAARRIPPPNEPQLERRLVDEYQAQKVIEQYVEYVRLHEKTLHSVQDERNRNTMRWYALTTQVPFGSHEAKVTRARYLLNRIPIHMWQLGTAPTEDAGFSYKEFYWKNGRTLHWANRDFTELFDLNPDVRDSAYALWIKDEQR